MLREDTVVHIHAAFPDDLPRINSKLIALLDMVVQKSCQEIVGGGNCMEITGKCRFRSSIGTTCAYPPPAAPPLIPKHGPRDGSLNAMTALFPSLPNASPRPTLVVVFPSPPALD